jgi:site-specific DNA recombinase
MNRDQKATLHCAIYTRKSSEEGLEQSFNSLDAQREASEAFIASQRHEGWRVVATRYDDGGYSGGTMERPALKHLLQDVEAGKIDVIVVYKVDRLTRSLADFAKIVEALDARKVSFVSVTQQFNTTTSMGRLTLNILLSFAQFEREVTGERIRDKIAASKKKGMWMGGFVPLGYDLEGRKLVPNPKEAERVAKIFTLYLEVGCVRKLAERLDREQIRSKVWITRTGARLGGVAFARGALYTLLRNRLYIGEIRHRDQWYPGEHEGIVPRSLWDRVQAQLDGNLRRRQNRVREQASSLLTGLVEDEHGVRYTPSFTVRRGRRYRYYVSQLAIKNPASEANDLTRVPAQELERRVIEKIIDFLKVDAEVFDGLDLGGERPAIASRLVTAAKQLATRLASMSSQELRDLLASFIWRITIHENKIEIKISSMQLRQRLESGGDKVSSASAPVKNPIPQSDLISLTVEARRKRCGGEVHLVVPPSSSLPREHPKLPLIKALARAHHWYEKVVQGKALDMRSLAREAGWTERYVGKVFRCAFLAPDIVEAILAGRQPQDLNFDKLCQDIPLSWVEQRERLGFSPAKTPRSRLFLVQ